MDINVYTDGSWINPLEQYLGLGGAGVWWPNRHPTHYHRLSQAECELAHYQAMKGGLMLYTPLGGYSGSSTRTELAAAIIALMANGPIHIGIDSQAFLDKASWILGYLKANKKHKVNWRTMGISGTTLSRPPKLKGQNPFTSQRSKGTSPSKKLTLILIEPAIKLGMTKRTMQLT